MRRKMQSAMKNIRLKYKIKTYVRVVLNNRG